MCFSVEVETDLKKITKMFHAKVNNKAFEHFYQLQEEDPLKYKYVYSEDNRVYAKIWAPVICKVRGKLEIRPMRYQLLPHFSPSEKYTRINPKTGREVEIKGTYNARLESLTNARAWIKPFLRQHAILPVKQFYEWVEVQDKKKLISFHPQNEEYILAPCLYDTWYSHDKKKIIQSFAIITTTPAPEVLKMGHDRNPINIRQKSINTWLSPEEHTIDEIISLLKLPKESYYDYRWA